jgi:uncharacterized protein YciW
MRISTKDGQDKIFDHHDTTILQLMRASTAKTVANTKKTQNLHANCLLRLSFERSRMLSKAVS